MDLSRLSRLKSPNHHLIEKNGGNNKTKNTNKKKDELNINTSKNKAGQRGGEGELDIL